MATLSLLLTDFSWGPRRVLARGRCTSHIFVTGGVCGFVWVRLCCTKEVSQGKKLLYPNYEAVKLLTFKMLEMTISYNFSSVQFSSVAQLCLTLCDPMDYSTPDLPVPHQLPKFIQTHAHWVGDAVQPSHPLSSPSPPALNLSQHHGLFKWVSSSHRVAKVLEFQLQISPSNEYSGLISFSMDWLFNSERI